MIYLLTFVEIDYSILVGPPARVLRENITLSDYEQI